MNEVKNLTSAAGCSHDVPVSNEKSKKKRPRYRSKAKKAQQQKNATDLPTTSDTSLVCTYDCSFLLKYLTVTPIVSNNGSKFIRRRSNKYKCIKISTFVTDFVPVTFVSSFFIEHNSSVSTVTKPFKQMVVTKQKTVVSNNCATTVIREVRQRKKSGAKNAADIVDATVKGKKRKARKRKSMLENKPHWMSAYLSKEEVEEGLHKATLVQGVIRINPKDYRKAYVTNEDRTLQDYLIDSVEDRSGALDGDEVVLQLKDDKQTAKVVCITDMVSL